ncbi:MAG: glycosyltransferase [Solirubrobacteraceae bacterium]
MSSGSVCVAMPVKNGAAYLREAIESVLAQEGADFTLHIVDNRSDDDSVDIARRYETDRRVRVDVNDQDFQAYGSLNRILAETPAEYYVPFAADDVMHAGNLARKLEALATTGAGFAHSTAEMMDEAGVPTGLWPDHRETALLTQPPGFFAHLAPFNAVSCQAVVVRTAAMRQIGGFDARSHFAADWLSWMRLSLRWPVATLPDTLISNRYHHASGTSVFSASGIHARDVPATLDRVFSDPAMPTAWADRRDPLVAASYAFVAKGLHEDGIRRVERGWAGYMVMGRGLARVPADAELREAYLTLVIASDLAAPAFPLEAVAPLPERPEDVAGLAAAVRELDGLLGRVLIAVAPDDAQRAFARLEPAFGDTDTDVALVTTTDPLSLLEPGRIALARWGSDLVAAAEARRVPVHPYAIPSRFDDPPDETVWQTVDRDACL